MWCYALACMESLLSINIGFQCRSAQRYQLLSAHEELLKICQMLWKWLYQIVESKHLGSLHHYFTVAILPHKLASSNFDIELTWILKILIKRMNIYYSYLAAECRTHGQSRQGWNHLRSQRRYRIFKCINYNDDGGNRWRYVNTSLNSTRECSKNKLWQITINLIFIVVTYEEKCVNTIDLNGIPRFILGFKKFGINSTIQMC